MNGRWIMSEHEYQMSKPLAGITENYSWSAKYGVDGTILSTSRNHPVDVLAKLLDGVVTTSAQRLWEPKQ
jgi:hypothetical protein